jgi:2-alkenal reductase
LGVTGSEVNLAIAEANNLDTQMGAYIDEVVPNGPADKAGLRGSTDIRQIRGLEVDAGGDVIVELDGKPIPDFDTLLTEILKRKPGDTVRLVVLREGERREVDLTLEPRPDDFEDPFSPN